MSLKPWREIAKPHKDVLEGNFQQAEFAADLSRVHAGTATAEYQNPALFYERTFITEGLRWLLDSLARRLSGKGGEPVIQLQTAFGGGKTHSLLAVYHLATSKTPASELAGVSPILDAAGVTDLPLARVVVLDGTKLAPDEPQVYGGQKVNTLWGELAWQLGGVAAYEQIKAADENGTNPGKDKLSALLQEYAPCVILMDELVAYLRQFEEGKHHTGGTFDSNLTFIQALTEAMKAVPTAILLASLPESRVEAGSNRGQAALDALEKYFGRVQAIWKPVATEEAFEIVRRRLFVSIQDQAEAEKVCRAFSDTYREQGQEFPQETQEHGYYERLLRAYPIHPEVFDRLYEDWSSLDKFQRTRGVLKLMAKVIHRLWKDQNHDLLIMPGSLPLYDADVRNESIYYLPQGWDPVLERDIDGERSETAQIESDTRFGAVGAAKRAARTIFLGSAPTTTNQMTRGIEEADVLLGCVQPGQQVSVYKDVLRRLTDRLHYLNIANNRFWFDTRPNLRREMEDRKRRYNDKEHVWPVIRDKLQQLLRGSVFDGVHVFTPSVDVPDDAGLRLVVLPPDAAFNKAGVTLAIDKAAEVLKSRGDQPRQRQNRLLFLAADYDALSRLKDQVRTLLAWRSIVVDIKDLKLNLDQYQSRQAGKSEDDAQEAFARMVRETYRWLIAPYQEEKDDRLGEIKWEPLALSTSASNFTQEIQTKLKDHELLIQEWAPIHLRNLLQKWYWKDALEADALRVWNDSCRYLYLPRLKEEGTFRAALKEGASSTDFFALAYGKDGDKYEGFSFGSATTPILDASLLLIEPGQAAAYQTAIDAARQAAAVAAASAEGSPVPSPAAAATSGLRDSRSARPYDANGMPAPVAITKRQFYGQINLDPVKAKLDFAQIVDEVVQQFTSKHDVNVKISVEITASSRQGFDDTVQRAVKENCNVLRFHSAEFEQGDGSL